MAIRKQNQVAWALGTTALSLQADADESIMVRGIYSSGATATHLTITVGQRTVGYFRTAGELGNHIPFPKGANAAGPAGGSTLFDKLFAEGMHRGFPIGAGQTMNWDGPNAAASVNMVLYDIHDRDDIKPDMPNGSESPELDYIVYGNTGATISTAGTYTVDTLVNPAEFDAFPYGADVPGLTTIMVYGILGSTFAPAANDGTNDIGTTYLKLTRNQTVLFDKATTGIPYWQALGTQSVDQIGAGPSTIGNYSTTDQRLPLIFPEPMEFAAGEELTIAISAADDGSGAAMLVTDQEIGLIVRSSR